jgi:hypothetical protein
MVFLGINFSIVLSFAILANQFIQFPADYQYDIYTGNYPDFSKAYYLIYIITSYDAYPDNQLVALRWSQWTNAIFLPYVILNMFVFVTIPGAIIFSSFRQNRSYVILMDEIRQQHSLVLAFVSLGEDNYHIENDILIRFLIYMYKNKARYVNDITEICLMLDDNNNGTIQINEFMQLCKILTKNSHMFPPQHDDFKPWVAFRKFINNQINLKGLVTSWGYKLVNNLIVILAIINCIAIFATKLQSLYVLDFVF